MHTEPFITTCLDGVVIHGELMIPPKARGIVQFNCGTATHPKVYRHFLQYLTQAGFVCALWHYRGSGPDSGNLAYCEHWYSDYGCQDIPAVKNYLLERFSHLPLIMMGHSTGGQQIGLMDDLSGIAGCVNIGVSCGYLPHMPLIYRCQGYWYFYAFVPTSIAMRGYVASKALGIMEDLPRNVATQWRDWCAKEDGFFDPSIRGQSVPDKLFYDVDYPITVYHASDETISTQRNTHNFWRHIDTQSSLDITCLNLADHPVKKIDHFGYFSRDLKDSFWPRVLADLNSFVKQASRKPQTV